MIKAAVRLAALFSIGLLVAWAVVKALVWYRIVDPSIWRLGSPVTALWAVICLAVGLWKGKQ